ncbi:Transcription factor IIS, N-terminal [Phytophthora cactorum]|nr:Transcription factor IIS, N-terminal [Phytophthora cactorum]
MAEEIVPNSVGWYILEGYPWWPVYICDVFKLRPNLHILGSGHKKILKKARDFPNDFIVVYYFGSHDFSLVGLKKAGGHPSTAAHGTVRSRPDTGASTAELVPQEEAMDPAMDDDEPMDEDDDAPEEDDEEEKKRKKKEKKEKKKKEKEKTKKEKKDKKRKSDAAAKKTSPKVAKTSETDALSIILEKEIRWILVNCPFEEMTTKTVRKLLEDRLHMDLRHHKASIKEGVARVIASMEEEDAADSTSTAPEETTAAAIDDAVKSQVKTEPNEPAVPVTPEAAVKNEDVAVGEEDAGADNTERMKTELEAASKNLSLALELEPKIMDALDSLKTLDSVDKDVLAASTLQPRLVKLRAHRSSKISDLVALLVKKWNVEELVPAPKPIAKEEILELKTKLEDSETSHDELLVCLNQLGEMALTIDHLKKTGIARAVSKLRQHGHELRQKWIKQINEQSADHDSGSNPLKTLKTLNRILDHHSDGTDEHKLHSKQLAALEQLHTKLAKKLRKKWQAEAKAKSSA